MIGCARFGLKRSTGSFELSMADYEIGYGKPPRHCQFKKGVCANPRGRPRRRNAEIGDVVQSFLSAKAQYREKGRTRKTSRLELAIKRHVTRALNGDVGSAAMLLKMRAHAIRFGDTGALIVRVANSLPHSSTRSTLKKDRDQAQGAGPSSDALRPSSTAKGPSARQSQTVACSINCMPHNLNHR